MHRVGDNWRTPKHIESALRHYPKVTLVIFIKENNRIARQPIGNSKVICYPIVDTVKSVILGSNPE